MDTAKRLCRIAKGWPPQAAYPGKEGRPQFHPERVAPAPRHSSWNGTTPWGLADLRWGRGTRVVRLRRPTLRYGTLPLRGIGEDLCSTTRRKRRAYDGLRPKKAVNQQTHCTASTDTRVQPAPERNEFRVLGGCGGLKMFEHFEAFTHDVSELIRFHALGGAIENKVMTLTFHADLGLGFAERQQVGRK
jgi:hypothetical protein